VSFASLRTLAACLAAAALAAGLAACGSSSSASSTASAGGGTKVTSAARVQARLNLAKCLRTHGINVPDPTAATSGQGRSLKQFLRSYPQAQLTAAEQSCKQYLVQAFPQLTASPAQQAQRLQQKLQYAECMRSHGINFPDPTTNTAPGTVTSKPSSSVDRNSPAFKAAATACASLRPKRGAGGAKATGG
jgi:hypothetical protein